MVNQPGSLSDKLAVDVKDVNALRQAARQNSPEALKETARQFEALFMNMVMKSMREATPQDGVFNSEQSKMYTAMLDQQMSQNMAKRGVGLADVLIRQLSNSVGPAVLPPTQQGQQGEQAQPVAELDVAERIAAQAVMPPPAAAPAQRAADHRAISAIAGRVPSNAAPHVKAFQERLAAHAEEASRTTGIPAKFMLGQAALESGWGKRQITGADGTPSNNLFGIKATAGWKGRVVETVTTEYVNGVPRKQVEKFRAYDSYADSFRDYARLLSSNPRYENVIANAQDASSFARGLQKAGYATDPNYAAKLTRIIQQNLST